MGASTVTETTGDPLKLTATGAGFPQAQLTMVATTGPPMQGVTYCTGIAEAELVRLFQQSWVYASPSVYEGFGLPYLEAMACGTAVVASPNPGSRELLLPDCQETADSVPDEGVHLAEEGHSGPLA